MDSNRRLLIVDDNARMRSLLRRICAPYFGEVTEAADGVSAIACFEAGRPDLVLMDIEVPGMDGLQTTCAIRLSHPAARIIVVTNHDSPEFHDEALKAGAFAFLSKSDLSPLSSLLRTQTPNPPIP